MVGVTLHGHTHVHIVIVVDLLTKNTVGTASFDSGNEVRVFILTNVLKELCACVCVCSIWKPVFVEHHCGVYQVHVFNRCWFCLWFCLQSTG